jgi:heme oxygenase
MTLREATMEKHKMAEQMPFNQTMFKGELTKEQYLEYLKVQHRIFQMIEDKVTLPSNFLRCENILNDIIELEHQLGDMDFAENVSNNYCNHLSMLDDEEIWSHVYLNYMALLFGGQMMKTRVPGSGRLYDFENSQDIIKSIREKQKDEWADEVNKGYDFMIEIFAELNKC